VYYELSKLKLAMVEDYNDSYQTFNAPKALKSALVYLCAGIIKADHERLMIRSKSPACM